MTDTTRRHIERHRWGNEPPRVENQATEMKSAILQRRSENSCSRSAGAGLWHRPDADGPGWRARLQRCFLQAGCWKVNSTGASGSASQGSRRRLHSDEHEDIRPNPRWQIAGTVQVVRTPGIYCEVRSRFLYRPEHDVLASQANAQERQTRVGHYVRPFFAGDFVGKHEHGCGHGTNGVLSLRAGFVKGGRYACARRVRPELDEWAIRVLLWC